MVYLAYNHPLTYSIYERTVTYIYWIHNVSTFLSEMIIPPTILNFNNINSSSVLLYANWQKLLQMKTQTRERNQRLEDLLRPCKTCIWISFLLKLKVSKNTIVTFKKEKREKK